MYDRCCIEKAMYSVLEIYQLDVFGPAEFHKAIGGGYAVVIDHAERVTFVRIQLFRRVVWRYLLLSPWLTRLLGYLPTYVSFGWA